MFKKIFFTIFSLIILSLPFSPLEASTKVMPFKQEVSITNKERVKKTVSFTNDTTKSVNITPLVFSYSPSDQTLIDTKSYIFVKTDIDVFTIQPNSTFTLNYEIMPPSNFIPGTYFNLIVLKKVVNNNLSKSINNVGATDSVSHLVVMHILDDNQSVKGISSDFATISMTIEENGIPFIRNAKVRYILQNTSNYVLSPVGEIQIFNTKSKNPPIYIKINKNEKKLYPGGKLEDIVEIEKTYLSDIFNGRKIVGRFYNGIDENYKTVEVLQKPAYVFIGICGVMLITLGILVKSLLSRKDN